MSDATRSDGLPITVAVRWPRPHVCLVQLGGELDVATVPLLAGLLREHTRPGPAHLVVDLAGVRFLASAGVGLILSAMRNDEGIRGRLHLLGVRGNHMVTRVLDLTGLLPLLEVHDALDELLDHLDQH
jgi:anti-sigma B factor antagonist